MDTSLLGYWSEKELYPGAPEYSDLGFRPDGSGWMYWASWSTEFLVHRFRWHVPAPGLLTARLHLTIGGEWSVADGDVTHQVEYRKETGTAIELGWAIEGGSELTLDRPLSDLCDTQFRFVEEGDPDPTLTVT